MRLLFVIFAVAVVVLVVYRRMLMEHRASAQPLVPPGPVVTLTEKAATAIREAIVAQKLRRGWLRVGVRANPGSEQFTYLLEITPNKPNPRADYVFDSQGISIAVDRQSALYLMGTELDYKDDGADKGFVFNNPNAKKE